LSWHYLAAWYDGTYLGARTGRVTPTTMLVPLAKVQSLRLTQGPWSRRLRLASLAGDTAGHHWRADLLFRDAGEVEALLARLADLARAARERSASGVHL
jgi:putative membrane protein